MLPYMSLEQFYQFNKKKLHENCPVKNNFIRKGGRVVYTQGTPYNTNTLYTS